MQASHSPCFETNTVTSASTRGQRLLDQSSHFLPKRQGLSYVESQSGRTGTWKEGKEGKAKRGRERKINHCELLFGFERVQQHLHCAHQFMSYSVFNLLNGVQCIYLCIGIISKCLCVARMVENRMK